MTIRVQRRAIGAHIASVPSLRPLLSDPGSIVSFWDDALVLVARETGLGQLPETCPWAMTDVLADSWLPPHA